MAFLRLTLACIFISTVVVAKKCDFGNYEMESFDIKQFVGQWYSLYEQQELADYYSHFRNNFQISEDGEHGTITSKANRDGKEASYSGTLKVKKNGFIYYKSSDLKDFTGSYKVVDTDYNCYSILRGCPTKGPVKTLTWIQYRSTTPSAECEEAAQAAIKKTGVDSSKLVRVAYN
ncbi:hypothetical protein C0J52_19860 [Blattella germanica]|nr:hypothetical protein C0J52_23097 [Blattella germanica]PSN34021.1 hypothetical protein C0J52_19860 [Blattella germanica]